MQSNGTIELIQPPKPRSRGRAFIPTLSAVLALAGGGTSLAAARSAAQTEERVRVHTEELHELTRKLDRLTVALNLLNERVATLNGQLHPIPMGEPRGER